MGKRDEEYEDVEGKRLLGGLMAQNFWQLYFSDQKDIEDYEYMIATYCHTTSVRGTLSNMLAIELRENGGTIRESFEEDSFYSKFHQDIKQEWNEWIKALDPLTQASALSGKPEDWYKYWVTANPKILTSWIFDGAFGYIRGAQQGSGKTSLASEITHQHIKNGGIVCTNTQFDKEVENVIWGSRMSVILRASCIALLEGRSVLPILFIVDETGENVSGIDPLKPKNKAFDSMSRSFRKMNVASLYISHKRRDFPDTVLRNAVAIFVKPSRNKPTLLQVHKLEGKIDGSFFTLRDTWYKGLPDSTLPYRTGAFAPFDMDVNFDELWNGVLAKLDPDMNQYKAILDWLDNRKITLSTSERKIWAKRLREVLPKLSNNEIGLAVGVSGQQVSKYLKSDN